MTNLERELEELLARADVEVENSRTPLMIACSPELSGVARVAMNESLKKLIYSKGIDEYDYIRLLAGKLDRLMNAFHSVIEQRDKLVDELADEALQNGSLCDYCVHAFENVQSEPCKTCVQHEDDDPGLFSYDFSIKEDEPIDVLGEN